MNQLFGFVLVIGIMLLGTDVITRATPPIHRAYRRCLREVFSFLRRNFVRFIRWAWRNYRQGIVGFILAIILMALTGHLN